MGRDCQHTKEAKIQERRSSCFYKAAAFHLVHYKSSQPAPPFPQSPSCHFTLRLGIILTLQGSTKGSSSTTTDCPSVRSQATYPNPP